MKDEKEFQIKISSKNKVKPSLLKSIYSQEVKNGRIDNNVVKIITTYEDMDGSKTDYSKLVYRSGDNESFLTKRKCFEANSRSAFLTFCNHFGRKI